MDNVFTQKKQMIYSFNWKPVPPAALHWSDYTHTQLNMSPCLLPLTVTHKDTVNNTPSGDVTDG